MLFKLYLNFIKGILLVGTPEQKEKYLPKLASGKTTFLYFFWGGGFFSSLWEGGGESIPSIPYP